MTADLSNRQWADLLGKHVTVRSQSRVASGRLLGFTLYSILIEAKTSIRRDEIVSICVDGKKKRGRKL